MLCTFDLVDQHQSLRVDAEALQLFAQLLLCVLVEEELDEHLYACALAVCMRTHNTYSSMHSSRMYADTYSSMLLCVLVQQELDEHLYACAYT